MPVASHPRTGSHRDRTVRPADALRPGHLEVARLLVEAGARLDVEDILFRGTPLDWAEHGGQKEVADYLRARGGG